MFHVPGFIDDLKIKLRREENFVWYFNEMVSKISNIHHLKCLNNEL